MTAFVSKKQTNKIQMFLFQKLLGHKNPSMTEKYIAKSVPMQVDSGLRLLGIAADSDAPERLLRAAPIPESAQGASTLPNGSNEVSQQRDGPSHTILKKSRLSRSGYRSSNLTEQGNYLKITI